MLVGKHMSMYKKLLKWGILGVGVCLFLTLSVYLIHLVVPDIVHVYEIRIFPERFTGPVGVIGKVKTKYDTSASFFLLDLNRKYKAIPIVYKDQVPAVDSEIIAYGRFRKADKTLNANLLWWEFYLDVQKVKERNSIFSGNVFYEIKQQGHMSRDWVYEKCWRCRRVIKYILTIFRFS